MHLGQWKVLNSVLIYKQRTSQFILVLSAKSTINCWFKNKHSLVICKGSMVCGSWVARPHCDSELDKRKRKNGWMDLKIECMALVEKSNGKRLRENCSVCVHCWKKMCRAFIKKNRINISVEMWLENLEHSSIHFFSFSIKYEYYYWGADRDSALNMQGEGLLKLTGQSQSFSTSRSTHACQLWMCYPK